ncbi:energy transducer TonB [Hyphococcus flavus]|uniref:Energy transducer TonB n=1 Tax=Hyphococcus flavus TaxID=1866326 RepID=A0AAE9ZG71_9PROT|nr:energy transducer TonB [Hyphococcus flavus]WDI32162.1 energy transducer TonB [Hyphococcus flavus]
MKWLMACFVLLLGAASCAATPEGQQGAYALRESISAVIQRAYDLMQNEQYQDAVSVLTTLLESGGLTPYERATVLELRANSFVNLDDYEPAINDLADAYALDALPPKRQGMLAKYIEDLKKPQENIQLAPIVRIPPKAPQDCWEKNDDYPEPGQDLFSAVIFDVTPDGTVDNIRVTETNDSCFADAVIEAVSKWRYQPRVVDGEPIAGPGQKVVVTLSV